MERTRDRLLVSRLQAGDQTAVQELADTYGPRILQLAMRHMRNREDAEEVTQDVLLKVHQKIGLFRGDAALSSWIYRITFNTAMSRLRNARATRPGELHEERLDLTASEGERTAVRGPAVFDVRVDRATTGSMSATIELNESQITALRRGFFYVQLHSEQAADGNLWGWLLPVEEKK